MSNFNISQVRAILAGDGHEPLSVMRITQLVREGMPKEARGQYDPVRCMYWYIGSLRRSISKRETINTDGTSSNLTGERKRLLTAQAEREEIELEKLRGQVVPIVFHGKALSDLVVEVRARIMSVPAHVAPQLVGERSRTMINAKIEKELAAALADLGGTTPRLPAPAALPAIVTSPATPPSKKKKRR